jgi:hypothetical protein
MALLGATSLTGCNSIPDFISAGSQMLFEQSTAPTSWTKRTTHNNKALRVVSGNAAPGGSTAFTSVFTSRAVQGSIGPQSAPIAQQAAGGSVANTTLATSQIPSHAHTIANYPTYESRRRAGVFTTGGTTFSSGDSVNSPASSATGGGGQHSHGFSGAQHSHASPAHNHGFTGTAQNFAVLYVDIIIAAKN